MQQITCWKRDAPSADPDDKEASTNDWSAENTNFNALAAELDDDINAMEEDTEQSSEMELAARGEAQPVLPWALLFVDF